ncbi:MAG TPA: nucleotide exchange factor GrpE [Candidatus Acidoferrum sp.]|nr:nucleotide exchange factor GrpE [Candidatus Acidoferrum sp.]
MTAPHHKREDASPDSVDSDLRESAAASGPSPLEARIAQLEAERDELKSTLVRRQADFENFRKRTERERHEESRRVMGHFIQHILPVLDGFERALAVHDNPAYEDYRKGFELIYKQLWESLAKQGLERIEAAGKVFDPHVHMAIERVETDEHEDGFVIDVLQPGYSFHGRVLRPATVRVAAAPADASNKNQN